MSGWTAFSVLALTGLAAACTPGIEAGRADFEALCASCHGDDARGGGWAAEALATKPADLTRIAARNGGSFDRVAVMSHIDGYTRDDAGQVMPDFGALLEGETVLIETGDGIMTPTPARLVALADYLESIQVTE